MRRWIALGLAGSLLACDRAPSSFAFELSGEVSAHVVSGATATGSVDNAGFVVLDDEAWSLRFALGGLAPGGHTLSKGQGEVIVVSKQSGTVFTSDLGTSCSVWIDPHEATNGSAISGLFTCDRLGDDSGKQVTVSTGRFVTYINDAANNPRDSATGVPTP